MIARKLVKRKDAIGDETRRSTLEPPPHMSRKTPRRKSTVVCERIRRHLHGKQRRLLELKL